MKIEIRAGKALHKIEKATIEVAFETDGKIPKADIDHLGALLPVAYLT